MKGGKWGKWECGGRWCTNSSSRSTTDRSRLDRVRWPVENGCTLGTWRAHGKHTVGEGLTKAVIARGIRLTPDRVFVVLASCFGIGFAIATPPLDPPDERHHLARIFALSEGHLSPAGPATGHRHTVPRSLNRLHPPRWFKHRDGHVDRERGSDGQIVCVHDVDDVMASLRLPLDPETRQPIQRPSTYGPIPYLPQAVTMWIGRAFGGSAGSLLYLARFTTLAVCVALGWLALRITPVKPWTLMLLCLSPMALFQASVVSADGITNALALLLLALALRAAVGPTARLDRRHTIALIALTAALGFVKQGLWVMGVLLVLIPPERFGNGRRKWLVIGGAAVGMAVLTVGWAVWLQSAQHLSGDTPVAIGPMIPPFEDFGAWLERLSRFGYRLLAQFVGILGHLDVVLPRWIYTVYPLVVIGVAAMEPGPPAFGVGRRLALAAIGLAGGFSVLLLLFAISPDPRTATAGMIQGRYFIPVAPLLLVALPGWRPLPRVWGPVLVAGFSATILGIATVTTAHHYFIGTAAAPGVSETGDGGSHSPTR